MTDGSDRAVVRSSTDGKRIRGEQRSKSVGRLIAASTLFVVFALIAIVLWSRSRKSDPEATWINAQRALQAGRIADANRFFATLQKQRKPLPRDWVLKAQLASAADETDAALAALAEVPKTDPLFGQASLMAGRLERARHRARASEIHFRDAIAFDPGMVDAHKELIYLYGIQSRRKEVDTEFRSLAKLTPLTHHDLFTWALTHSGSWRPDIAKDLQAMIDADPDDRAGRLALAEILLDQPGEAGRVREVLSKLPANDPDALALKVGLDIQEGKLDSAESQLAQGPSDHPALARYRGRLAMARGHAEEAVSHFRQALSSEPYDRVSTFELGQALNVAGKPDEARDYLERAKRLNELYNLVVRIRAPDQANQTPDLLKLGNACEDAGLKEEARHWFELAIRQNPLDGKAQAALYRIGKDS